MTISGRLSQKRSTDEVASFTYFLAISLQPLIQNSMSILKRWRVQTPKLRLFPRKAISISNICVVRSERYADTCTCTNISIELLKLKSKRWSYNYRSKRTSQYLTIQNTLPRSTADSKIASSGRTNPTFVHRDRAKQYNC